MKRIIFLVIALIFSLNFYAKAQHNSLLWKVSGKNIKDSYLYGTIHIQDERVFVFEDFIKEKINNTEAFSMEILFDDIDFKKLQSLTLMKNQTLKELVSEEDFNRLDEFSKQTVGVSIIFFNRIKPFFTYTQLMQAQMRQDRKSAMDLELMNYAKKRNKKLFGLEKMEDQIKVVDKISLEEQVKMLLGILEPEKLETEFIKMKDLYLSQNISELYNLTTSNKDMPENFTKTFLHDRNKKMARSIIRISRRYSSVHAFGAAHLAGEKGIIEILRRKGYTVEPVVINPN